MSIAFGRTARSLAFLSMFASPMHLASAQTPTQRDHNTIKIVGDVRQPFGRITGLSEKLQSVVVKCNEVIMVMNNMDNHHYHFVVS